MDRPRGARTPARPARSFARDPHAASETIGPILLVVVAVVLATLLGLAYNKLRQGDVPVVNSGAKATFGTDGYWLEPTGPNDIPVSGSFLLISVNGSTPVRVPLSNFSASFGGGSVWGVGQRICIIGTAAGCWATNAPKVEVTLYARYNFVFSVKELLAHDVSYSLSIDGSGGIQTQTHAPVRINNVGSQIHCGSGGPTIPVTAAYTLDGGTTWTPLFNDTPVTPVPNPPLSQNLTLPSVPLGAVLGARGTTQSTGGCTGVSYQSVPGDVHVLVLRHGDPAPDKAPFGNQAALASFLQPYVNTASRTMVLDYNQVILLFEFSSDVSSDNPAADFQDLVILFTFE